MYVRRRRWFSDVASFEIQCSSRKTRHKRASATSRHNLFLPQSLLGFWLSPLYPLTLASCLDFSVSRYLAVGDRAHAVLSRMLRDGDAACHSSAAATDECVARCPPVSMSHSHDHTHTTHTHTHTQTQTPFLSMYKLLQSLSSMWGMGRDGFQVCVCVCVSVCEFGHVLQNERIPSDVCPHFSLCRRIYVEKRKRGEEQKEMMSWDEKERWWDAMKGGEEKRWEDGWGKERDDMRRDKMRRDTSTWEREEQNDNMNEMRAEEEAKRNEEEKKREGG